MLNRFVSRVLSRCARPFLYSVAALSVPLRASLDADVWTDPRPALALHGSGDILAAATSGGVVLWDLSRGAAQLVTTSNGLPSHITMDLQLASNLDQVYVATDNGLARGWFEGGWQSIEARADEQGTALFACLANPSGGCLAGGRRGALIAWHHQRVDSLRVPTRTGRVVGLEIAPQFLDGSARSSDTAARLASAPAFPLGLVVALDNDGVWLLRDSGVSPRWLRVGEMEGLPSRYVRDVGVDADGFIWVATRSGMARIGPGTRVTRFDADPLLSQRIETLLVGSDGHVYLGLRDGLARVDPRHKTLSASRLLTTTSPVVALAWTHTGLWWSDGARVQSLAGTELELPRQLAANYCEALASFADTVWVGHPWGRLSRFDGVAWTRHGPETGLPTADINGFLRLGSTVFAATSAGLYAQQPTLSVEDTLRFAPVVGSPAWVAAQEYWQGAHWVGGPEGLWRLEGGTWTPISLWTGASEIVALAAAADTLWATAGHGGIACRVGSAWGRPPVVSQLADAYWGRMHVPAAPVSDSLVVPARLVVATNRGVALWNSGILRPEAATPNEFITDVAWWNDKLVCGTHRGLWLRASDGAWVRHGVDDGLPGVHIRRVVDDGIRLWVNSTRGVARYLPGDLPTGTQGHLGDGFETEAVVPGRVRIQIARPFTRGTRVVRGTHVVLHGLDPGWALARSARVYDVRGRRVRTLLPQMTGRFIWDTRDDAGRLVARGLFFARPATVGHGVAPTRLLVLR